MSNDELGTWTSDVLWVISYVTMFLKNFFFFYTGDTFKLIFKAHRERLHLFSGHGLRKFNSYD